MRRAPRDWAEALQAHAGKPCRNCGVTEFVQLAHTIGRRYDPLDGHVDPLSVVPLCGPEAGDCHAKYDAHDLDILGVTTYAEQGWAASRIGLERARNRFIGKKEVAA